MAGPRDFLAPTPSVRQPLFETSDTVASKMITPEKLFFYELIRRGVIYYAGKFLPQSISFELINLG